MICMVKAIIFDLGGVLFTNGTKSFIKYLIKTYNLNREKVNTVMHGEIGSLYRESKISRDEFWERFLNELGISEDADKLETEWINQYELITETKDLIKELSKKYKLLFLSDNVKERVEKLNKEHDFISWFEDGVFSHEVGVRKPNPKIYRIALQKAGVRANEAIFIDDIPQFLQPAAKMGMKTILFTNSGDLRKKLLRFLIN